jgi:histidine triad (HIT) family protein
MSELSKKGGKDCVFCRIIAGELPCEKVFENEYVLAFLDKNPQKPGHTLVVPKKHFLNIMDCPDDTLTQIFDAIRIIAKDAKSFQVVQNNNRPIQEVFHLHFHVIPW